MAGEIDQKTRLLLRMERLRSVLKLIEATKSVKKRMFIIDLAEKAGLISGSDKRHLIIRYF